VEPTSGRLRPIHMFKFGAILLAAGVIMMTTPGPAEAAAAPALRVTPNPVTQGQTTTAFLEGFCGASTCSPVTLLVDGVQVGTARADAQGKMTLRFVANQLPGQYSVTARQTTPSGPRDATTGLVILISDQANGSPPPPSTSPTRKPSPSPSVKPTREPDKTNEPTKSPTRTSGPDPTTPPASDKVTTTGDETDKDNDDNSILVWVVLGALVVAGSVLAWRLTRRRSEAS
jgi:hypothetical protein